MKEHNLEAFYKYYSNATKEQAIEDMYLYNCKLEEENEYLRFIIKEVREYITKQVHRNQQFYEMDIENILEILDKDITEKSDCNYEKAEKENK